ncbi:winged helix-turn-helix domain-containing protein [Virgifigura deserti]|uniref:winged helix-turn-helix domain-containing protein n=1 Tax=Virgifigura deserti TaxID=2268457 RepID=UPI003CCBB3BE
MCRPLLKKLGFSPMSARPRHPAQDAEIVEAYKRTSRARWTRSRTSGSTCHRLALKPRLRHL